MKYILFVCQHSDEHEKYILANIFAVQIFRCHNWKNVRQCIDHLLHIKQESIHAFFAKCKTQQRDIGMIQITSVTVSSF